MAFYVLHFFEDIDEVVRRIYGLLILETACLGGKNKIMGKLLRLAGKLGFLPLINMLTTRQIEQALEQAGFSIVDKTKFSESNDEYTLIAKNYKICLHINRINQTLSALGLLALSLVAPLFYLDINYVVHALPIWTKINSAGLIAWMFCIEKLKLSGGLAINCYIDL